MAGMQRYENLKYELDDDDQMQSFGRFQYQNAAESEPHYQYVNSERDFTLPLLKHKNAEPIYESPDEDISIRKYIGVSVSMVSLIAENLLSHPFMVLRRQCQVHHNSTRFHIVPITLMPVIVHLHQRQGVTTLWKGLGSCLLVRGMSLAVEDLISKVTPWPKEVHARSSMKQFGQHILLKCISIAVVVPFNAASLVETVQSDIASEKPGVFDVFREGISRLSSWSAPQKGRMIPVWALLGPSISLGLTKYIFGLMVKGVTTRIMRYRVDSTQEQRGARCRDTTTQNQNIEIYSTLLSIMSTELLFYPFETILHRIQLQGTRTIIDNLDSGYSVLPILTSYEGAIDCYKTTVASEGVAGLYKGFGATILQFAAHLALIKLTKWVVTHVMEVCSNKPPTKVAEFYQIDPAKLSPDTTTASRSLSSMSVE